MDETPKKTTLNPSPIRKILRMVILAAAVLLLPTGIACFFSAFFHLGKDPIPQNITAVKLPKHLADLSISPKELEELRIEMRDQGLPLDDINLRIWAGRGTNPEIIYKIEPPEEKHVWNWKVSADGHLALAYSSDKNAKGQRIVGLYDLIARKWNWQKETSWPENCDKPQAIPGYLLVRYFINNKSFVMEVDPAGVITTIEPVGHGTPPVKKSIPQDARIPFRQIERINGVTFTIAENGTLLGFSSTLLPGLMPLKDAETSHTTLSGNGRIQFVIKGEMLHLYDPISGVSLADYSLFRPEENLDVKAITADTTGRHAEIYLRSSSDVSTPQTVQISVDVLKNTVSRKTITTPIPFSPTKTKCTFADKKWSIDISKPDWVVIQTTKALPSTIARIPISLFTNEGDLNQVMTLEDDRHLVLRKGEKSWLLDIDIARHYADKLANLRNTESKISAKSNSQSICKNAETEIAQTNSTAEADLNKMTNGVVQSEIEEQVQTISTPAYTALWTDLLRMNQLWSLTLTHMLAIEKLQQKDNRAPRLNPFILARVAGHEKAWDVVLHACRELQTDLMADRSTSAAEKEPLDDETGMIQFQAFRTLRGSTKK